MIKDKIILISGGSGSFGNAMIKKLLSLEVKEIRVFSRNEKLQADTKMKHNDNRIKFIVGDIRDYKSIYEALNGVDYVFHASAMKHIDKCQDYPLEAKATNIDGTINISLASIERGVKKVVYLSTDKSANPTTIYGLTKLFGEMFIKCVDNKNTEFISTRYGNVLGSNGSVVHIFNELVRQGKPITLTNPEMTRFFMTLEEAVDLVLYALEHGVHKDLFVYKNKSCTIQQLADCFTSNQVVIGNRCIEKNDEALLTINELDHSELNGNYYRVSEDITNTIHTQPLTSDNAERFANEELKEMLDNIKRA